MDKSLLIPRAKNRCGGQTLVFENPPRVASRYTIVGDMEGEGTYGDCYDKVLDDDLFGRDTWEQAECRMFEESVKSALQKESLEPKWVDCLLGGDLLNQLITANFAARQLSIPFLGLYGACSTMAESLLVGASLISGGFASLVACAVTSHFCTAERQYRFPLEMGTQRTPTAQRTVTGAGCTILACDGAKVAKPVRITHGTIGRVVDMGVTDVNNMGAAMAPAAADTIAAHLMDTNRKVEDYDLIVTGDLGTLGEKLCRELCLRKGVDLKDRYLDCGSTIFNDQQDVKTGGSGCGCSAVVLNGHLLEQMLQCKYARILFVATGALLSVDSSQQGESIPGVAHGVVFERC